MVAKHCTFGRFHRKPNYPHVNLVVGQMLLPSNQTVQQAMPQAIQTIYDTGKPPESLLALPPAKKQE